MKASVDDLANEIRRVDGSNSLGAGALAEALLPFLKDHFTLLPKLISARICFNLGWQAGYTSGWQGPKLGICAPQAFDESAVKDLMAAEPSWTPIEEHDGSRRPEVLLIGRYPDGVTWSDVYHDWWVPRVSYRTPGHWKRWPHPFPPTHFMPVVPPQ